MISDVRQDGDFYRVFDGRGRKVVETHVLTVGKLCGIGRDFILGQKGANFVTYNKWFERLWQIHQPLIGEFLKASGSALFFSNEGSQFAYDKMFQEIDAEEG